MELLSRNSLFRDASTIAAVATFSFGTFKMHANGNCEGVWAGQSQELMNFRPYDLCWIPPHASMLQSMNADRTATLVEQDGSS